MIHNPDEAAHKRTSRGRLWKEGLPPPPPTTSARPTAPWPTPALPSFRISEGNIQNITTHSFFFFLMTEQ